MRAQLTFLLLFSIPLIGQSQYTLMEVREWYEQAYFSEGKAKDLATLDRKMELSNTLTGYVAGAKIMLAKHYWNPISKYLTFCEGRDELEGAINRDRKNFELRYLRLVIQSNSPYFLDYFDNINEDKEFIFQHFHEFLLEETNAHFAEKVLSYLGELKTFTNDEIESCRELIKQAKDGRAGNIGR